MATEQAPVLLRVTAEFVEWITDVPVDVAAAITAADLRQIERPDGIGYDIHIRAYDVDQVGVDRFAKALGVPSNEGWEPPGYDVPHRQWSISATRNGLIWQLTATSRDPLSKRAK